MFEEPLKIEPAIQNYAWGKMGRESLVAQLIKARDPNKPYAEMWMGAHPKNPSTVLFDGNKFSLSALIERFPKEILGASVVNVYGKHLPFILKVLSIRTALSIQLHPDKTRAKLLHENDPEHYPDANHKPEIAIAATHVEALIGFKTVNNILESAIRAPEFGELILTTLNIAEEVTAIQNVEIFKKSEPEVLSKIYSAIMCSSPELITKQALKLFERVHTKGPSSPEEEWILALEHEYPKGDVGLFNFFILNHVTLKPGQAIFSPNNTPHAYLRGDLVECMSQGDNTVRAGLTQKFKDVEALLNMADYEPKLKELTITPEVEKAYKVYNTQTDDFKVCLFNSGSETIHPEGKVEMFFCLKGDGSFRTKETKRRIPLSPGDCYIVPASVKEYTIEASRTELFRVIVPE